MSSLKEVKELIPQRAPFLFVDEIVERGETSIETMYKVTGAEDFFKGHFPDNPIMPGVILQEALFQTGACLMASGKNGGLGVVTKVAKARFKSLVRPGATLMMKVELTDQIDNAFYFKGRTQADGKTVCSLEFTCAQISE